MSFTFQSWTLESIFPKRSMPIASLLLLVLALLLFIGGLISRPLLQTSRSDEFLYVPDKTHKFESLLADKQFGIQFLLSNPTPHDIKILGASRSCSMYACLDVEGLPLIVPAKSSKSLSVQLTTRRPGFAASFISLYTDCSGSPELELEVKGTIVANSIPSAD